MNVTSRGIASGPDLTAVVHGRLLPAFRLRASLADSSVRAALVDPDRHARPARGTPAAFRASPCRP